MGHGLAETFGAGVSSGVEAGLKQVQQGQRDKRLEAIRVRKAKQKRNMEMAKDLSKSLLYKATDSPFNSKENVASRKSLVMATLVSANGGEPLGPGLKHMVDFWVQQDADQVQVMAKAWLDKALKGKFNVTTMVNLGRKGQPSGALPAYIKQSLAEDKEIRGREAIQGFMGKGRSQTPLNPALGQPPRNVQIPTAGAEAALEAGNLGVSKDLLSISKSFQTLKTGRAGERRAVRNQEIKEQELVASRKAARIAADKSDALEGRQVQGEAREVARFEASRTAAIVKRQADAITAARAVRDEARKEREDAAKVIERSRAARNQVIKEQDRVRTIGKGERDERRIERQEARTILKENEARLLAGINRRRDVEKDVRAENEEIRKAAAEERKILEAELVEVHRILNRQAATTKEKRLAETAGRQAFEKSPAGIDQRLKAETATKLAIFKAKEVSVQDKRFLFGSKGAKLPRTEGQLIADSINVPRDPKVVESLNQKENALRKAHGTISGIIKLVEGKPENLAPAGAVAGFLTSIQRGTAGLMNLIPGLRDFVVPDSVVKLLDELPGLKNLGRTAEEHAIVKSKVIGLTYQVGALSGQTSRAFSDKDYEVNSKRIAAGTANDKVMVAVLRSIAIAQSEAYAIEFFHRTGVKKRINIPGLNQDDPFGDLDTEGMKGVLVELLPKDAYNKFKDAQARLKKRYDPGGNF
jgi:hypothetical protein